jgi:hypothetical protein
LPERPPQGKLRADLTYDWREVGEQVTDHRRSARARHLTPMQLEDQLFCAPWSELDFRSLNLVVSINLPGLLLELCLALPLMGFPCPRPS